MIAQQQKSGFFSVKTNFKQTEEQQQFRITLTYITCHMLDNPPYFSDFTPVAFFLHTYGKSMSLFFSSLHLTVFSFSSLCLIRRWLRYWIIHVSMPSFTFLCSQPQTAFWWTWRESIASTTSKEWWTSSKRGKTGCGVRIDSWCCQVESAC